MVVGALLKLDIEAGNARTTGQPKLVCLLGYWKLNQLKVHTRGIRCETSSKANMIQVTEMARDLPHEKSRRQKTKSVR